jgi:hypothetical protein
MTVHVLKRFAGHAKISAGLPHRNALLHKPGCGRVTKCVRCHVSFKAGEAYRCPKTNDDRLHFLAKNEWLAAIGEDDKTPDDYLNHSCDPNLWIGPDFSLATLRDVAAGEELTIDYALWTGDPLYVPRWSCECMATCCRRTISHTDWMRIDLIVRYRDHFMPFLNGRIETYVSQLCSENVK